MALRDIKSALFCLPMQKSRVKLLPKGGEDMMRTGTLLKVCVDH